MRPIYFDYNATTPLDPRVLDEMIPYFKERFGNPESSQHAYGWEAKTAVENARAQVAQLLGASAQEIIFTSGSTESLSLAILGFLETQAPGRHIITSSAEHKATLAACTRAEKAGHELTILPVNSFGQVSVESVLAALKPNTALVTLMHANNEVGSLTLISEIGRALRSKSADIAFHVDAAQTAGKVPIDVDAMNIDMLSISGHKFYAPKGIGALYVRKGRVRVSPLLSGGGQERGLRGGTHNVPAIVGLGKAAEIARAEMASESERLTRLRDRIIHALVVTGSGITLNGHPTERLPNNVHLRFTGIGADDLLKNLRDFAFSMTSACSSGGESHVLKAIGSASTHPLIANARFGLGRFTTDAEVDQLIETIQRMMAATQTRGTRAFSESLPEV